jgi:hypothetical protein
MSDERRGAVEPLATVDRYIDAYAEPHKSILRDLRNDIAAALASSPSDGEPPKPVACEHVPLGFEDDECSECEEKPVIAVLESGEQLCLACFGERFDEMAAKLTTERDRPLDPDPVAGRFSGIGKLASVAAHPPRSAPASPADIGMLYAIALRDETPPEDRKHLRALADRLAAAPAERETGQRPPLGLVGDAVEILATVHSDTERLTALAQWYSIIEARNARGEIHEMRRANVHGAETTGETLRGFCDHLIDHVRAAPSGDRGNG